MFSPSRQCPLPEIPSFESDASITCPYPNISSLALYTALMAGQFTAHLNSTLFREYVIFHGPRQFPGHPRGFDRGILIPKPPYLWNGRSVNTFILSMTQAGIFHLAYFYDVERSGQTIYTIRRDARSHFAWSGEVRKVEEGSEIFWTKVRIGPREWSSPQFGCNLEELAKFFDRFFSTPIPSISQDPTHDSYRNLPIGTSPWSERFNFSSSSTEDG